MENLSLFTIDTLKTLTKTYLRKSLSENLKNMGNSFEVIYDTFTNTLDCYATLKKKKYRSNQQIYDEKTTSENYDKIPFAQ